jgi:hypothetical protein
MFYGLTMPWLVGHAFLAWDSWVAITQRFRRAAARS